MLTSSKILQLPFVTVHLKTAFVPAGKPVTVVVAALISVIVGAVPVLLNTVHTPEPTLALWAIVKSEVSHNVWSAGELITGNASF